MSLYFELWRFRLSLAIYSWSINSDAILYCRFIVGWRYKHRYGFEWFKTGIAAVSGGKSTFQWVKP